MSSYRLKLAVYPEVLRSLILSDPYLLSPVICVTEIRQSLFTSLCKHMPRQIPFSLTSLQTFSVHEEPISSQHEEPISSQSENKFGL